MGVIVILLLGAACAAALALAVEGQERFAWMAFGAIIGAGGFLSLVMGLYVGVVNHDFTTGGVLGVIGIAAFIGTAILLSAVNRDRMA